MPEPINYMAAVPQVDLGASLLEGLKLGSAIRDNREKRAEYDRAEQIRTQYTTDLQNTLANPTPQAFAALTAKYPQQREAFKQSWDMMGQAQKDAEFNAGVQAYSAITSGNPDIAKSLLDERIAAMDNSGKDSTKLKMMRQGLDQNPSQVASHIGLVLSSVDPDKWGKMAGELRATQKAPAELTEAQAKAQEAATKAKFAESNAVLDLQKKDWDITKIQEDIKIAKDNNRIAALNAAIAKEGNGIKKEEMQLKLAEFVEKRDTAVREKAAGLETARSSIDNMLNTADRILKTPLDVIGNATGPLAQKMPTVRGDTADFEELVQTLGSQAFISQIPAMKGMGALSNAEGEKLQAALQNFSLRQSPDRLVANVKEAQRLILKARSNLAKMHGVPDTVPDTPAAAGPVPGGKSTDDILRELGVMR